jgi:molecular chaperone GrpE
MDNPIETDRPEGPQTDLGQAATQLEELPVPAPLSAEQIQELRDKAAKADEFRERMLREAADFDNYRKRAVRERHEAVLCAYESLLQKLIPALDAFDMALALTTKEANGSDNSIRAGIVLIANQVKSALAEAGLQEVDATGKNFDPNLHEALSQEQTDSVPEGQVVRQIRKGYKFRNRLIRPAGVVVAKGAAAHP